MDKLLPLAPSKQGTPKTVGGWLISSLRVLRYIILKCQKEQLSARRTRNTVKVVPWAERGKPLGQGRGHQCCVCFYKGGNFAAV